METQNVEVINISLERTIETKLVQNNVTKQVIAALKEKYGSLRLRAVDDKESYLEIKSAARDCAKIRTLTVKICKEGREEALKTQKLWIAKEKEVVGEIAQVEDALDAEVSKFDVEVERIAIEERNRQEEAYINRQAALTKMGATYVAGSFVLGSASFEANLIKGASQGIWEDAIIPKFIAEYEIIESEKLSEQRKVEEHNAELKKQQEELQRQHIELRQREQELMRQKEEADRVIKEKMDAEQYEREKIAMEEEYKIRKVEYDRIAEENRLADIQSAISLAIKEEKERYSKELLDKAAKIKQEEENKIAELESAGDKKKWQEFINSVNEVKIFEMRSSQYRKKMQIAKEKIHEILAL